MPKSNFQKWAETQYRNATPDEFVDRKNEVISMLEDSSCEVPFEELRSEQQLIVAENERRNALVELRNQNLAAVAKGAGEPVQAGQMPNQTRSAKQPGDLYATEEYERAFYDFIKRGQAIPAEYQKRDYTGTTTGDASAVIPTTTMKNIIKELKSYGNIYNKVTKLKVQGGIEFPVADFKVTAKWIGETETSDYQKISVKDTISFKYFTIEARLSQTLLSSLVTFDTFQREFPRLAAEAIIEKFEQDIISGAGTNCFLGVTKDTRVADEHKVAMTEDEFGNWQEWQKKFKAKVPQKYRRGHELVMSQGSWDGNIASMTDTNGQPIARENIGINGEESYRFLGMPVEIVDAPTLPDFADAEEGDVVAIYIDWKDYAINSQMQLTMTKWVDHETNEIKYKALAVADGKIVDAQSVYLITKKNKAAA